ncbi:hypothetical protein L6164_004161 [Bauhinia variegata]|uniref:Uncharacterized protein n=1 Tax=Bauhinia variegata TaxID=167791 RepID=A0ACB9Q693_BAUVA|nr:hypothetical protein L6164_004161 [Bauhinia variegata]
MSTFGTPNISDLIPILKPFDPQGIRRKLVQEFFSGLDAFYNELVEKRLEAKQIGSTTMNGKRDSLDVLLEYKSEKKESGYETFPRKVIKGMLSEMFMGGTVTSSSTIEWGMTEILKHPHVYRKVVEELDQVVGKDRFVEETDISNLHYFQAVIK